MPKEPVREPAVGDVAKLISGGPSMTIVKIVKAVPASTNPPVPAIEPALHCWWFDGTKDNVNTLCKAEFPVESLALVTK